jgi:hypothetical protein
MLLDCQNEAGEMAPQKVVAVSDVTTLTVNQPNPFVDQVLFLLFKRF